MRVDGALAESGAFPRPDAPSRAREVVAEASAMAASGELELVRPASGRTKSRHDVLAAIASRDLCLARIAEGHVDALAILAEAGQGRSEPSSRTLYGVWAADAPQATLTATRIRGGWSLSGRKRYASGARGLARALVTAAADDGKRLFDIEVRAPGVRPVPGTWDAVGMDGTDSLDVIFDDVFARDEEAVGAPGFYLERPGFWHGAVGVAACWLGGALGAYRMLLAHLARTGATEHQAAHLGAIAARCASMQLALDQAAEAIDASAGGADPGGRIRALITRHLVEDGCQEVLTRVGRASGSSPLVSDAAHARRAADLIVYLRQHHAERDLAALGQSLMEEETCRS